MNYSEESKKCSFIYNDVISSRFDVGVLFIRGRRMSGARAKKKKKKKKKTPSLFFF